VPEMSKIVSIVGPEAKNDRNCILKNVSSKGSFTLGEFKSQYRQQTHLPQVSKDCDCLLDAKDLYACLDSLRIAMKIMRLIYTLFAQQRGFQLKNLNFLNCCPQQ